jgi:hypothetical protein
MRLKPCQLKETQNKNRPKLNLLAMTEADRRAFTKQIKECLLQRVEEAKLNRRELLEDDASLDTDARKPETRKPETHFHSWYLGY